MSYAGALYGGMSSFRRTAFVGPKLLLDVVDDIRRFGRIAYLGGYGIDLTKGKTFDARLKVKRVGDHNWDGASGGLPPGGVTGRLAFRGVGSKPVVLWGITKQRITYPNIYNRY